MVVYSGRSDQLEICFINLSMWNSSLQSIILYKKKKLERQRGPHDLHPNMHTLSRVWCVKTRKLGKEALAGVIFSTYLNFDLHNLYLPKY